MCPSTCPPTSPTQHASSIRWDGAGLSPRAAHRSDAMPFTLNPEPATLGISAPYLGRWFTSSATLPPPTAGSTLGLTLILQTNDWRPPATGVLSLFVAKPTAPPAPL